MATWRFNWLDAMRLRSHYPREVGILVEIFPPVSVCCIGYVTQKGMVSTQTEVVPVCVVCERERERETEREDSLLYTSDAADE